MTSTRSAGSALLICPRALVLTMIVAASTTSCHIVSGFDDLELREDAESVWSLQAGDELEQSADMVGLYEGNIRMLGHYEGELDFSVDAKAITPLASPVRTDFVAQFSEGGVPQWAMSLPTAMTGFGLVTGTPYLAVGYDEAVSLGGLMLDPASSHGFGVIAIDTGATLFSALITGEVTQIEQFVVATGSEPTSLVMGITYQGQLSLDSGSCAPVSSDDLGIAVAVVTNGECVFLKSFGDTQSQRIDAIASDSGGNIVVGGRFLGTIDFGARAVTSSGGEDYFVVKLSPTGEATWAKSYGDIDELQGPLQLAVRSTGTISLAGYFAGDVDFGAGEISATRGRDMFAAKLDPSGNTVWVNHYAIDNTAPAAEPDHVVDKVSLAVDSVGNTVLAGHFRGAVDLMGTARLTDGDLNLLLVKLDADGLLNWSGGFGDATEQCELPACSTSLVVDSGDHIVLGGGFQGVVDFGGADLKSAGSSDVFLSKFIP